MPKGGKLVGVFGFLNDYKGLGTAIRALRHLPDDHHLLIFGGIHPNEIVKGAPIHPYLATLYDDAYADATPYAEISGGEVRLTVAADRGLAELIGPHPRDVSSRIHFMGAPDDEAFLDGMASCDVVVLPYLEVGQSSSGPISQAVELGCRVIGSRTHAFLGFAEYHPNAVEFFDIGNYLELAERIRSGRQFPPRRGLPEHNIETNRAVYVAANAVRADAAGSTVPAHAARAG
jgi:glycosyltransferase involved in cell wall biosynthesis